MRRCKLCKKEIQTASKCTDIVEKKGYCSVKCLAEHTTEKRIKAQERKERKVMREAKEKVKTRSQWQKEAQTAFNAYIRERDKDLPCISCGRFHDGQYHAGHFKSVGAHPALRFEPLNCHKQCSVCNNWLSGNLLRYRENLEAKIGADNVAWLDGSHEPKKYTIQELKQIKAEYKAKLKELKASQL